MAGEANTEGVVDADGPGHALLALDGGEDLSGVLECNRAFAQGIAYGEQIDEQDDGADLLSTGARIFEKGQSAGK